MPKKKKTNADVLRSMIEINDLYKAQNGEGLITERVENEIKNILNSSDDDDVINVKFNRILKPTEIKK